MYIYILGCLEKKNKFPEFSGKHPRRRGFLSSKTSPKGVLPMRSINSDFCSPLLGDGMLAWSLDTIFIHG